MLFYLPDSNLNNLLNYKDEHLMGKLFLELKYLNLTKINKELRSP